MTFTLAAIVLTVVLAVHAGLATLLVVVLRAAHGRPGRPHGRLDHAVLAVVGRLIQAAVRRGVRLGPVVMLTVPGRTTGLPRSTPVDLWVQDDRAYLVATHDQESAWVRNLRAGGAGSLAIGRRSSAFTATELPAERAGEILATVVAERMRRPLGGLVLRQTIALDPDAGPEAFAAAAARHPVFELDVTRLASVAPRRTTRHPGTRRLPAALIALGLAVAAAHAVAGAAGALPTGSWLSGVALGLLIAGAGNHLRIFGPRRTGA